MSGNTHELYDRTDLSIYGSLHLLTMRRPGAEAAEFLQNGVMEKQNPEGCYVDCARALFQIPASQWGGIQLTDQVIHFGEGDMGNRPATLHCPSQLAFCFLNGINRLDDAYTLANYTRYLHFCRQNQLSVSCWSSEAYRAGLKVFDQVLEQGAPAREPGRWYIHQNSQNRYYEGALEQLIEALRTKELDPKSLSDCLVYCGQADHQVSEYYGVVDIQVLDTLAKEAGLDPVATVKDWIEQGVAPTLLGLHYEELLHRLEQAGLKGSIFTSAFRVEVVRSQRAMDRELNSAVDRWPDLRDKGFQPTLNSLKEAQGWTASLLGHQLVRLDLQGFVQGEAPLKPMELMEVLVKQAQSMQVPLNRLYDSLPGRLQKQTLAKEHWGRYRLELAQLALGDPSQLIQNQWLAQALKLSPEEWHVLVVKEPKLVAQLPVEVIGDWKFWHPMTDLAGLGDAIKPLIPEYYFKDPDFQRLSLMTGLVQPAELGWDLLGINADDLNKVLRYGQLTMEERQQPQYRTVALGVVLHDPKDIGLIPECALDNRVIFAAAYQDIDRLNQLSAEAVAVHRLTDEQLNLIIQKQADSPEAVTRFAQALPATYHSESVLRSLNDRLALFGVKEGLDREAFLGRSGRVEGMDNQCNRQATATRGM